MKCSVTGGFLPEYQSEGASGADLRALLTEDLVLKPGTRALVPTGLCIEIPRGLEGQVRPRSGMALKNGVTVLNSPGTVDSDYRGEIKIILINLGESDFRVRNGDRIAQIVFSPVVRVSFQRQDAIASTQRGSGGFGSTGT
ncbi:MAG: dUTP diphosphatase [Spirochaetia bacterium]